MLNGSLESFALPEVLRFIAGSGITGRVEIEREEVSGELSLDQGTFVAARLSDDEAPANEDEALDVAVLLFDGTGGSFKVEVEDWAGGPLRLDADGLSTAVEHRREQWAEVVASLGSLEDPLMVIPSLPDGTEEVTITAGQWRLLSLVDGRRSAQDIGAEAAMSTYAAAVGLAELAARGLIAADAAGAWEDERTAETRSATPDEDPAEMLREIAGDDPDEDEGETTATASSKPAKVRPLRVPTREEQRVRLRR